MSKADKILAADLARYLKRVLRGDAPLVLNAVREAARLLRKAAK